MKGDRKGRTGREMEEGRRNGGGGKNERDGKREGRNKVMEK